MYTKLSVYLCRLLRHHPEQIGLDVDTGGWASVEQLIEGVNNDGQYVLNLEILRQIVKEDEKGRYRFSEDGTKIKCCQAHSIPWVIPLLAYGEPPEFLYHGTTAQAWEKIQADGFIKKMQRHAVHMLADPQKAWNSATRWRLTPVVLKIAAGELHRQGVVFGETENHVWCAEQIPASAVVEVIRSKPKPQEKLHD